MEFNLWYGIKKLHLDNSTATSHSRDSATVTPHLHKKVVSLFLLMHSLICELMSAHRYGVAVQDFGKSWTSGLAFLAVIKSIDPSLVDMRKALLRSARENLEDAFRIAHYSLGIPRLLEPEGNKKISIFPY